MFEAQLDQGSIFKNILEAMKELVTDCNLDCSEEELTIQSMDSAHVALVSVRLSSNAFSHYRCDKPNSLGINTPNIAKIFKMMGKDDSVTLKAEEKGDSLMVMFEGSQTDTIADFEIKLMDIDNDQLGIPETPYKCTIKMPSKEFQRIVNDLQVLGDTCTISCTKEGVRFSVSGSIGTGNVLTRTNNSDKEENLVAIDMDEPVELNFALRYLNFFTKATALSPSVIIQMSPEVPVLVEYPINDVGAMRFYLAPKIEED